MFGIFVDGKPTRAFSHEYVCGTRFEGKDLGVNRAYAFSYPAAGRTPGMHTLQIKLGKQVTTTTPGKLDTIWMYESPPYTLIVTEGEDF